MNVAVIGAGAWGRNLVRTFHELGTLTAVVEADTSRHAELKALYPEVDVLSDPKALLTSAPVGLMIDAVAIATPPATHAEIASMFLEADKHVFVEKPMTLSRSDAVRLQELATKHDRTLMVGHMLLYQPAIQWIKAFLDSGRLGQLRSIHQERLNLGRARSVENALWSLGVHDIAVLLYLVGNPPDSLVATGQRALQETIEDDVYLHMRFSNEVQGHLHVSWLWPERRRRLHVIGSEGMLVYDELGQTVTLHRKGINADLSNRDDGSEIVFQGDGEPLRLELQHFLECAQSGRTPLSDGRNGIDVVTVLEEASRLLHLDVRSRGANE